MKPEHRYYFRDLKRSILDKKNDMSIKEYRAMLRDTKWKIKDLKSELEFKEKILPVIEEKINKLSKKKQKVVSEKQ